jgi:hypothetical protein
MDNQNDLKSQQTAAPEQQTTDSTSPNDIDATQWKDLSGDGQLLKRIVRAGQAANELPPSGAEVQCHYVGTLQVSALKSRFSMSAYEFSQTLAKKRKKKNNNICSLSHHHFCVYTGWHCI